VTGCSGRQQCGTEHASTCNRWPSSGGGGDGG
jgi:hypothetical protein